MEKQFNRDGFYIVKNEAWRKIKRELVMDMLDHFDGKIDRLEDIHKIISSDSVNEYRLKQLSNLNESSEAIHKIIEPFWSSISKLIGPDCLRQKRINLVIHMPQDEGSLIPLHTDVKTGNSSFEIGLWLPLTRCTLGNTMSILPYSKWTALKQNISSVKQDDLVPIISEGEEALFFRHFLPHGNIVNRTDETRVSLNVRFKGLFSPDNKKTLLNYYTPWKISEFTNISIKEWEE